MLDCQKPLFDLPADAHYLNCAYMAPLARPVEQAGLEGLRLRHDPRRITAESFFAPSDGVRSRFARLIGASDPGRVAILPAVSYGMAVVARNTPLKSSQNVVVLGEQFPSNYYAWSRLCRDAGAELRVVPAPDGMPRAAAWNEALLTAIDSGTAVVAMANAHWSDGTLFDLRAVRAHTREVGAALVVDGTQTVGALPFDVATIEPDALVCAAYKTLFGPYGNALGWFGERYDTGVPLEETWAARRRSDDFARLVDYQEEYRPGAVRFDVGERGNHVLTPMLSAALDLVLGWDPAEVQRYCEHLVEEPLQRAAELGFAVEPAAGRTAHLFGLRPPGSADLEALRAALDRRGIAVSIRGTAVRVSPNVYNDGADLDALVEALAVAVQ